MISVEICCLVNQMWSFSSCCKKKMVSNIRVHENPVWGKIRNFWKNIYPCYSLLCPRDKKGNYFPRVFSYPFSLFSPRESQRVALTAVVMMVCWTLLENFTHWPSIHHQPINDQCFKHWPIRGPELLWTWCFVPGRVGTGRIRAAGTRRGARSEDPLWFLQWSQCAVCNDELISKILC